MKFLVDADVLSEATKASPNTRVVAWLTEHERDIAIDPIILGEVRFGILLLPKGRRRERLERWFDAQRIHCVPFDAAVGLTWSALMAKLRKSGRAMPIKDSLIAATALTHDLAVVTRNRNDFEKAGVRILIPSCEQHAPQSRPVPDRESRRGSGSLLDARGSAPGIEVHGSTLEGCHAEKYETSDLTLGRQDVKTFCHSYAGPFRSVASTAWAAAITAPSR